MAQGDNGYEVAQIVAELQSSLLTAPQRGRLEVTRDAIKNQICGLELVGDPAELTAAIGNFHFLKGRLALAEQLLDDHEDASQQMAAVEQSQDA